MSRALVTRVITAALVLAMTIPVLGAKVLSKDNGAVKTSITLSSPVTIGGKQLKAGQYSVIADESKVTFKVDGKVVAEAPAQWQDAKSKFDTSSVVLEGNDIREIRFGGKSRYVVIR